MSPFDTNINLKDASITLLIKSDHYDILYNENELEFITYDAYFETWVKQVKHIIKVDLR